MSADQPLPALTLTIDGIHHVIRKVTVHTKKRFEATYKSHELQIWLDEDDHTARDRRFYIIVQNPHVSFGTAYDGWAPEETDNLEDAIKEALRGSQLLRVQKPATE